MSKEFDSLIKDLGCKKASDVPDCEKIPTGISELDRVLSGGLPRGHVSEWFGSPSSHKTTVLLKTIANCQKNDPNFIALFCDNEGTFDRQWAKANGIDLDRLLLPEYDFADDLFDKNIYPILVKNVVDLIVIDSVATLNFKRLASRDTSKESERDVTMNTRLERPTRMTDICNDLTGGFTWKKNYIKLGNTKTHIAFINHLKKDMQGRDKSPGGEALKFRASIRVKVRLTGKKEFDEGSPISQNIFVKVLKNKVGIPFLETELKYSWEKNDYFPLLDYAVIQKALDMKLVEKSANGFFKSEYFKGSCKEIGFFKKLQSSPELVEKLGIDYKDYFGEGVGESVIEETEGE